MPISLLDNLLGDWKKLLTDWAGSGTLTRAASEALLLKAEPEPLKKLVGQWSHGDFCGLPPIVLLPASSMPGAAGAYAISTGSIYLNQDWLAGASAAQAIAVLTEELGHHLDGLLNTVDTPGDEGEAFSIYLLGSNISSTAASDAGSILLAGGQVHAELASLTSSPAWIRQFGTLDYEDSYGVAVALDGKIWTVSSGRYLLDGQTKTNDADNYLTVFNSDGTIHSSINSGSIGRQIIQGIAASGSHVYVGGQTTAPSLDGQANNWGKSGYLSAYDLAGNKLWTRLLPGYTGTRSITAGGSGIYVAGFTFFGLNGMPSLGGGDAFLAKYDTSGNLLWTRLIGGSGDNANGGTNQVSGNNNFVAVAGYTNEAIDDQPQTSGAFVSFFSASGTKLWTRMRTDGIGPIYVGPDNSVYISNTKAGTTDFYVTKLNSNGNEVWSNMYGTAGTDIPIQLTINSDGELLLLASTTGAFPGFVNSGAYDHAFIRISVSTGALIKADQWGSTLSDIGKQFSTADDGTIYLAGSAQASLPGNVFAGGASDPYLLRFNVLNPSSINLAVSPATVTEDGASNLIYTFSRTGPTAAALTVNYSIAGTADATDYSGATPGTGKTITFAAGSATATLTIDPTADSNIEADETVAITLATGTGYTVGTAIAVVGTIINDDLQSLRSQWLTYSSQATDEWSGGIAMFSNGDIATAFSVSKSNGSSSVIVQRLSTTGAVLWSLDIDADYAPSAGSILIGADDTIYVVGGTRTGATGESGKNDSDVFASAITKAGQKLWYKNYGTGIHEIGSTAVLDANGNILLEGRVSEVNDAYTFIKDVPNFYGAEFSGGWRGFQLRINPADGTVAKAYTTGSGNSGGGPIAIDHSRNIAFIAGYTFGAVNGVNAVGNGDHNGANTYLIARNESTGVILWTRMENWIRSNIVSQGEENALYCVDKGSLEKINGTTGQTIWSKSMLNADYILSSIPGGGVILSESSSSGTLVIRRFDANGTENGSQVIAHTGQLFPRSFVEQGNGTIQVSGSTSGTITVPTGTIVTAQKQSGYDSFVLQFNSAFSDVPVGVPIITLIVSPASATEDNTSNLLYTFTRTGPTSSALSVNYTVGGTATLGTDYTGILSTGTTKTISFAAGSATATLTIDPTADSTIEANETVALTLAAGTGYTVGTATAVVGTITNDDFNSSPTALNLSATSFAENIAPSTTVASLSTIDPDVGNTFAYSLVSGAGSTDNGAFSIAGDQIKIKASPNFEVKPSYSIRVRTKDQGGLFFDKNITLTVNNVNEAPTAIIASAIKFDENIAAGSTVASLSTTDPDVGNTFTYALVAGAGSTDNAAFTISGNQLKIKASPNFEAKSSYKVRVRTTDQGGLFREENLVIAVNNLVEKVTASTSTILAADKDTLELTGAKNLFGRGNQAANWIIGNLGKNKITGGLGKDILTGAGGVDTFFYGSLKESLLSGFDIITDYAAGEKISVGFDFEGDDLIASAGSINALGATQISTLLTSTKFLANTAEAFTVQNISGTFVALNDAVAGFQDGNDALIHLSNYTISASNPVSII